MLAFGSQVGLLNDRALTVINSGADAVYGCRYSEQRAQSDSNGRRRQSICSPNIPILRVQ